MRWIALLALCCGLSCIYAAKDERIGLDSATLRAGLRFAVEVPFNNVAANSISKGSRVRDSLRGIFSSKGMCGFYAGGSMEAARSLLWYPRMWIIHQGADLPCGLNSIAQAIGVAALEAATMPLFRARTAMMVESRETFRHEISKVLKTAYSGTGLRTSASWVSWYVYFETDAFARQYFKDNHLALGVVTVSSQVGVAVLTAPIYVVLINRQKLTDPCELSFWDSVGHHYKLHGSTIFYRTAKLGAAHLTLQAVLTTLVTRFFTDTPKGDSMQH